MIDAMSGQGPGDGLWQPDPYLSLECHRGLALGIGHGLEPHWLGNIDRQLTYSHPVGGLELCTLVCSILDHVARHELAGGDHDEAAHWWEIRDAVMARAWRRFRRSAQDGTVKSGP